MYTLNIKNAIFVLYFTENQYYKILNIKYDDELF